MIRRLALSLIIGGTLAIAAAYLAALVRPALPAWAPWAIALGAAAVPAGLFVLGAAKRGRLSSALLVVFALVFIIVAGCFGLALALPAREGAGGPLLLGLPLRTAIVLYGVGFLPLVLLPVAYALSFDSTVLREDDLERLREAVRAKAVGRQNGRGR
jgi:hypothetical protein